MMWLLRDSWQLCNASPKGMLDGKTTASGRSYVTIDLPGVCVLDVMEGREAGGDGGSLFGILPKTSGLCDVVNLGGHPAG